MRPFECPPRVAIYQIFVDRFAGKDGDALSLPTTEGAKAWLAHAGGHLEGIARRISHILELGCDALYLTPIFAADSNHKYDVSDYYAVDERFGGEKAFIRLASLCQEKGVGLILDGVFNHVGRRHPWFLRAQANPESREAEYFLWLNHPDEYECWQGHRNLPELNLMHDDVLHDLFRADDAVLRTWLRKGATGWRLDCANDLGPRLCAEIAQIVEEEGAADGAIGEVMAYAEEFVRPGGLHGVMNYYFRATVLSLLKGEILASQAAANFKRMARRYNYSALLRSWNVLATHDTPRLASLLPDKKQQLLAWALAVAFPGVPYVYYGEEIGMNGGSDPHNRAPMAWDERLWDSNLLDWIKKLIALRRNSPALRSGGYEPLPQPAFPTILAFARTAPHPADTVVFLANTGEKPVDGRFFIPLSSMFDSLPLHDLLREDRQARMESGSLRLALDSYDAAFLVPVDVKRPAYSFFSGYDGSQLSRGQVEQS